MLDVYCLVSPTPCLGYKTNSPRKLAHLLETRIGFEIVKKTIKIRIATSRGVLAAVCKTRNGCAGVLVSRVATGMGCVDSDA